MPRPRATRGRGHRVLGSALEPPGSSNASDWTVGIDRGDRRTARRRARAATGGSSEQHRSPGGPRHGNCTPTATVTGTPGVLPHDPARPADHPAMSSSRSPVRRARARRLHPDRDPGGAADPRHHVRPRLRDLSRRAHLRGAHRGVAEALARDRVRDAHDGHGFRADGAAAGARSARPDPPPGAARLLAATAPARAPPASRFGSGGSARAPSSTRCISTRTPGFSRASPIRAPTPSPLAELTRAGWSNTAGQQRGTLQRVSYALVDDVLKRSYTTALDTVQGTQAAGSGSVQRREDRAAALPRRQSNLAEPVAAADISATDRLWTRPVAVEITIEFKDWGRVRRLVEVAG